MLEYRIESKAPDSAAADRLKRESAIAPSHKKEIFRNGDLYPTALFPAKLIIASG
jgi:hypothetical protein